MQKPEPKLTHMPPHIKQMITNGVNMGTKLALSRMSKEFQSLVEESPIEYYCLNIRVMPKKVVVRREAWSKRDFGNLRERVKTHDMEFHARRRGVLMRNPNGGWKKVLTEKDYRKAAVQYFFGFIRPNTIIKKFQWEICNPWGRNRPRDPEDRNFSTGFPKRQFEEDLRIIIDETERLHNEFKHQLIVEDISIKFQVTECQIIKILGFLEPGTLKKIDLSINYPSWWGDKPFLNLEQISETEQWKRARELSIFCYKCDFPYEKWGSLYFLHVWLTKPQLTMKAMLEMLVSRLTFEFLEVVCDEDLDQTGFEECFDGFEQLHSKRRTTIRLPDEPTTEIYISYENRYIQIRRRSLS